MARNPIEKDIIDGLRDMRALLATLNRTIVTFAESIDKRFDDLETENMTYRQKRLSEEVEQLRIAYEKKTKAFEEQTKNGNTTQKMKTIASEAVKTEIGAKQIDWGGIWRKNVVPALATTLTITIALAALAVIVPGFVEILQKAFIR